MEAYYNVRSKTTNCAIPPPLPSSTACSAPAASTAVRPHETTPIFTAPVAQGFDIMQETADHCLWLALLSPKADRVPRPCADGGRSPRRRAGAAQPRIVPAPEVPTLFEEIGPCPDPHAQWEITRQRWRCRIHGCRDVLEDTTRTHVQRGVLRTPAPAPQVHPSPVQQRGGRHRRGGDQPLRFLDSAEKAERLISWLAPAAPDPRRRSPL
ncbi:MAG: hypothetical protein R2856_32650 [Caldilineaceae bacterium]